MKRENDRIGAGGTAIVSAIVNNQMQWIFRPIDEPNTDYGVDALIEVTDEEGVETGRLVAVQIKSGKSYFGGATESGFINRPSDRHVTYWRSFALPVILILVDVKVGVAYWAHTANIEATDRGGWKLLVPRHHVLGIGARIPLSQMAVGGGTERTRARSDERERTDNLERRIDELQTSIAKYTMQLASLPEAVQPDITLPVIDALALSLDELITWADKADFVRDGVAEKSRATYVLAARHLYFQKTITEHDAARAIVILLLAGDWMMAGSTFLYSLDLARTMQSIQTPSVVDLLAASALPSGIPLDLRIILRSTHIAARRKHGRPVDSLLDELDHLVADAGPDEGYAVTVAAFTEARAVGRGAPVRALRYIVAAGAFRPLAKGFGGAPFPSTLDATWSTMLELTAGGVASEGDLDTWLAALDAIPAEARENVLADEMNCVTLANRFWLDESAKEPADRRWTPIHRALERIENWSIDHSAALCFAAARRARIVVRGEYEEDLRDAVRLAVEVPQFVGENVHARFLLSEIAASQFLYAGARMESLAAFRGVLAMRPINSSLLPMTLLKAAQAAGSVEEFPQAVDWARDAVKAVRGDRYRAPTDAVVAHAELALAQWFSGEREAALDLWDEATEELFAAEEDTPRWRGLVVRFHYVGGYLINTYRTGMPPTVDGEGKPYGEPRPGAFLIDLAGQAPGFTDKVRFGVLLGLAAVSDQRARDVRTRRWIYPALDLAKHRIPEWRRMTALLALPHLISDGRFAEVVELAREMSRGWEAERSVKGGNSTIVAMSFSVVPAVLAIAQRAASERTVAVETLRNACLNSDAMTGDPILTACEQLVELTFLSTEESTAHHASIDKIREADAARLPESPIPVLCDIASTLNPETSADKCLALHARALLDLESRLRIFPTMYRLHIAPFFKSFWRTRVALEPQAFIDTKRLEAALSRTDQLPLEARPRAVLLAVAHDIRL